ncbi:hypothetical protein GCM10022245_41760 [Streptomyces mayteni]
MDHALVLPGRGEDLDGHGGDVGDVDEVLGCAADVEPLEAAGSYRLPGLLAGEVLGEGAGAQDGPGRAGVLHRLFQRGDDVTAAQAGASREQDEVADHHLVARPNIRLACGTAK